MKTGLRKCLIALGAVVLPGCGAQVGDDATVLVHPAFDVAPKAVAPAGAHGPSLTPNAQRYQDLGAHPATGRSGSAALVARALLGKDGTTDLELTTGQSLDSNVAPPGNIKKAQLKVLDASDSSILTANVNHLSGGGYVDEKVPGLQRGERLQVQANIDGIDARRTDVVTVPAAVKLRPDLAASELRAPKRAWTLSAVLVGATIKELNGDVGATANCVMSVDGVEVDHADGIWVDAGGTVSCRFQYRFPTSGAHQITISAASVVPGDWDLGNNAVSVPIEIAAPVSVEYSASATEVRREDHSANWGWFDSASYYRYYSWTGYSGYVNQYYRQDYGGGFDGSEHDQSAQFDLAFRKAVTFPLTKLSLGESSGSTSIANVDLSGQAADFVSTSTGAGLTAQDSCIQRWDGNATVFVCTTTRSDGTGETHVHSSRAAGDVTYHSYNYYGYYSGSYSCSWTRGSVSCSSSSSGGGYYSQNSGGSSSGVFVPMGSSYAYALSLTDGDLAYAPVNASVALAPYSFSSGSTIPTCSSGSWSSWYGDLGWYYGYYFTSTYSSYTNCRYDSHTVNGTIGFAWNVQSSAPPSP